jgi:tetratricopeptide (TPR) repeat protein
LKLGRGRRRYETSVEAYDLYLRSRALLVRGNAHGYEQIIDLLGQAIAKDSSFAPAYAGLAAAHAARSGTFRFPVSDELPKLRAAAEKAIQLDPLLAEAHDALGMAYTRDARWEESEQSFRRAIEIDPSRSESHRHFASFLLLPLGRIEEALRQLRLAEEADPFSWPVQFYVAYVLISAGRYDEAAAELEKQPGEGDEKALLLGRIRLGQGRTHEAIEIFEKALERGVGPGFEIWGELGYAYARAGRHEDAEKLLGTTPSRNPLNHALILAGLGDKDRTFEALHRAAPAGPYRLGWVLTWPEMSLLRGDPRVKALRKKVGLPE